MSSSLAPPPLSKAALAEAYETSLAGTRLWTLPAVMIASPILVFIVLVWALRLDVPWVTISILMDIAFYGSGALWLALAIERQGFLLSDLLGRIPKWQEWPGTTLIAVGLIAFAFSSQVLITTPVLSSAPEYLQTHFLEAPAILDYGPGWPAVALNVYAVVLVCVAAPVLEEVIFRGVMFRKWRLTMGAGKAALLSSAIFAVLHADVIGAFVFALIMVVVYSKSGTLWIPILCHAIHNLIAIVGEAVVILSLDGDPLGSAEELIAFARDHWLTVAPILVISGLWSAGFVRRGWRRFGVRLPPLSAV